MMSKQHSKKITLGLVQMACEKDPIQNHKKAIEMIHQLVKNGANLVCLPELFLTQYFCQIEAYENFDFAETIPGPSTEKYQKICRDLKTTLILPLFEKRTEGIYHNTVVTLGPQGNILAKYRKMHIPDDPNFYEKFYFTPGDLGFQTFSTQQGKMASLICWDQWYPEAARLACLKGAQVLFYPTAIGYSPEDKSVYEEQKQAWQLIQRSHGIANGVFVAAANRIGQENKLNFWGSSFISNPMGKIIAQAEENQEIGLIAEIDLSEVEHARRAWPFFRDRRIEAYQGINSRYLDD